MPPDSAPPRAPAEAPPRPAMPQPVRLPAVPPRPPRPISPRPSRLWRWRWRILILLLAVPLAFLLLRPALLGPLVAPIPVLRGDLVQSVVATGRVEAPNRVTIASRITGTIAAIPVAEGQRVAAGQVLIALAEAEARAALAEAEASLRQAEARLAQIETVSLPIARETLIQNEANLANAQRSFDRATQLRAGGTGTETQLDEARRALAVAQALARAARTQIQGLEPGGAERVLAETQAAQAKASLDVAQARLDYTRILAPADGTLIGRSVESGWVVQPGQALMVLSPDGPTRLVVQIDEKNFSLIAPGQAALASADAYPDQRFAARIGYISPAVDPQRASIEVKLDVADPPGYLRQDMTVSVDIAVAERRGVVVVPLSAVHGIGSDQPWVLVVENGRAVRRDVRIGLRGPALVEVQEGLRADERVLPGGAEVAAGGRVRVP